MKKMIYGLAIAAMAVGVSAFTNKAIERTETTVAPSLFYNITGVPSNDPDDYVYDPDGICEDTEEACRATWEHTGQLDPGDNPNGAKLSPDEEGTYTE